MRRFTFRSHRFSPSQRPLISGRTIPFGRHKEMSTTRGKYFHNGCQLMISGVQKALISGWYPVDILNIWLLYSAINGSFQRFSSFYYSLTTIHWNLANIQVYQRYFLRLCWNLSDIKLKFGQFSLDIRFLYLWYPADILDILIYGVQISSKMLPLVFSLTFLLGLYELSRDWIRLSPKVRETFLFAKIALENCLKKKKENMNELK